MRDGASADKLLNIPFTGPFAKSGRLANEALAGLF
ncbi:hypothetical protein HCH_02290 [Hahella chejuensis KCTC 2396]|uniref:Uncharacterized protein n=1 Tax=Hahella chejuensis (strain KCTC 2396) TaxID=349521 RepID=Q2SJR1_HAHCH|nr:hypothetical protein HCH_02290 [Hahella chejuensis KCTC 2396]